MCGSTWVLGRCRPLHQHARQVGFRFGDVHDLVLIQGIEFNTQLVARIQRPGKLHRAGGKPFSIDRGASEYCMSWPRKNMVNSEPVSDRRINETSAATDKKGLFSG